ncbi:MAG: hypothetical protein ACLFQK_10430, partial [Fibrobacterota bacterium]
FRLELRQGNPDLLIDVCHNPSGTEALSAYLSRHFSDKPAAFLLGILKGKDAEGMMKALKQGDNRKIIRVALRTPLADNTNCKNMEEGIAEARKHAKGGLIIICGSFHTVEEAAPYLGYNASIMT